ncbi:2-hydroxychromene-2-carboxylate isomerase [Rhodocyclus gracilis]|uniref:2-hydroxychromene-2-carboxylate isomerase n=1 Tax=Rhodocyclus gracilis TaxID=2929842 RepID=UPI001E576A7E|nr:2-hydroxychromene-2-carboxylate isomerase [Rhodocyclus gracilis]
MNTELSNEQPPLSPIQFYFDFSSPYGYLASTQIDALAARHGRRVVWRPILLGVIFRTTGAAPLTEVPLKGDYARRDFARSARFLKVPFRLPAPFPVPSQAPARATLWLRERDPAAAAEFARALYRAYFVDGRDIAAPETSLAVAAACAAADRRFAERCGVADADALYAELGAALAAPALKEALKAECATALAAGVFGSPFFIVDGEAFFGVDRLPQLEHWLAEGGF